ncbi:MAG: hypothetical protein KC620_07645 [Myxococcales bacterium]|nr:hypothetical protein [Myxococcales bacterium]
MRVLLALSALLTLLAASPASADDRPTPSLSKADRLAVQRDIVAGKTQAAVQRLDRALPAGGWCGAELTDPPKDLVTDQLRADLGVLARRAGRKAEAIACFDATLNRRTPQSQAATLFEAALLVGTLNQDELHDLAERMRDRTWVRTDCEAGRPCDAGEMRRSFLWSAAMMAPARKYVEGLRPSEARTMIGAVARPFIERKAVPVKSRWQAVNQTVRAALPPDGLGPPQLDVRTVGRGGPWTLLDVRAYPDDGDGHYSATGVIRSWLLLHQSADGALSAYPLGDLDGYRYEDELAFGRWDPEHRTISMRRAQYEPYIGPYPGISTHETVLCQIEDATPRCISSIRRVWHPDGSDTELTFGGVPTWSWAAGRLHATVKPGEFMLPEYARFEGLGVNQALAAVPEVLRDLAVALGHPDLDLSKR